MTKKKKTIFMETTKSVSRIAIWNQREAIRHINAKFDNVLIVSLSFWNCVHFLAGFFHGIFIFFDKTNIYRSNSHRKEKKLSKEMMEWKKSRLKHVVIQTIQWHTVYPVGRCQMGLLIAWCITSTAKRYVRFFLLLLHNRVNEI